MTNITFGIELEVIIPTATIENVLNGIGWSHTNPDDLPTPMFPPGWKISRDGSLSGGSSRMAGREIVSPILTANEEGIKQVLQVAKTLTDMGAIVNSSCGGHIHVGVASVLHIKRENIEKNLDRGQRVNDFLAALVRIVADLEDGIYSYSGGYARKGNDYCKSAKNLKGRGPKTVLSLDRYQAVNITNLSGSKKTVEFRLFAGTLDPIQLAHNIRASVRMCRMAKQDAKHGTTSTTEIRGTSKESIANLQTQLWGKADKYPLTAFDPE